MYKKIMINLLLAILCVEFPQVQYIDLRQRVRVVKGFRHHCGLSVHVVVQYYPWFTFYFPLFWGMVMYDNEFETKENKIKTKDKIE